MKHSSYGQVPLAAHTYQPVVEYVDFVCTPLSIPPIEIKKKDLQTRFEYVSH